MYPFRPPHLPFPFVPPCWLFGRKIRIFYRGFKKTRPCSVIVSSADDPSRIVERQYTDKLNTKRRKCFIIKFFCWQFFVEVIYFSFFRAVWRACLFVQSTNGVLCVTAMIQLGEDINSSHCSRSNGQKKKGLGGWYLDLFAVQWAYYWRAAFFKIRWLSQKMGAATWSRPDFEN